MDEATTKQNEQPRGSGRDVIKLVQEDWADPTMFLPLPLRGLADIYKWSRSITFYLKSRIMSEATSEAAVWGKNIGPNIIADLEARAELGEKKYGERLKSFNGRDALVDAYQEALDLSNYLRQKIEELEIKK